MQKIYSRLIQLIFIYIFGAFLQGCNIINPSEKIPTYIHVDSFKFNRNVYFPSDITTSHQITTVWAYYNNSPIGSFDLPATIPVLTDSATGTAELELAPGIAVDGLNNMLAVYPFYQIDASTFTVQPGKIINYTPQTTFYDNAKITVISNFEGPVNFSLQAGNIPMVRVTDPSMVFEGSGSGSITLHAVGDSSIDSSTVAPFAIPSTGSAFIEFNYKSEIPFYVGLQANLSSVVQSTPYFLSGINPSDHWQKFYLSIADFGAQFKGTSYTLYFKANLGAGQTSGQLLLDNIQLITY